MEFLDQTKQILKNVYLDILNNPKRYSKQKRYYPTEQDKKVEQIKKDYKKSITQNLEEMTLALVVVVKSLKIVV